MFASGLNSDNGVFSLFSQKLAFVYVFALLALLLFLRNRRRESLLVFSLIPVFSISLFPAVVGGVLLYGLSLFVLRKDRDKGEFWIPAMSVIVTGGLITGFYLLFRSEYTSGVFGNNVFVYKLVKGHLHLSDLKRFGMNYFYWTYKNLNQYLPFLLLFVVYFEKLKRVFWLVTCFLFSGLLGFCFMYDALDSQQFAWNPFVLINILITLSLAFFLGGSLLSRMQRRVILGVYAYLLLFCAWNSFVRRNATQDPVTDQVFFKQVEKQLGGEVNAVMVFLHPDDFKKYRLAWCIIQNNLLPVQQFTSRNLIFTLGNASKYFETKSKTYPDDVFYYRQLIPANLWKQKYGGDLADFIKENRIRFLYARRDTELPPLPGMQIRQKIKSDLSGDAFYVISP